MNAFLRAFLFCNGCDKPFETSTVPSARTRAKARRDAKRSGWTHKRDGRDLCEDCNVAAAPKAVTA